MAENASKKPCPWCGVTGAGFRADPPDLAGQAKGLLRLAGFVTKSVLLAPRKLVKSLAAPMGFESNCGNCGQPLIFCPYCDTPNRKLDVLTTCFSCAKAFG